MMGSKLNFSATAAQLPPIRIGCILKYSTMGYAPIMPKMVPTIDMNIISITTTPDNILFLHSYGDKNSKFMHPLIKHHKYGAENSKSNYEIKYTGHDYILSHFRLE